MRARQKKKAARALQRNGRQMALTINNPVGPDFYRNFKNVVTQELKRLLGHDTRSSY